jgi:hypothetical protein
MIAAEPGISGDDLWLATLTALVNTSSSKTQR